MSDPIRIDTMLPEGVKTKKCKRKPKVKPQPELPASPNEEISPKTKIPQGSRSELEVGRETPETEVLTVPQPLVSGQESGVSSSMPPPKDRPIRSKLSRRFYEPILLLHLLDSIRGTHIKRHTDSEDPRDSRQERRRDLTDAIAYICAFNTGGKHVTAAALEATPQGITVWLAVNGDIAGEATIVFLRDILTELENIDDQDQASQERTEARVFSKIVGFNKRRVKEYWKRAKNEIDSCLGVIRGSDEFEGVKFLLFSSQFPIQELLETVWKVEVTQGEKGFLTEEFFVKGAPLLYPPMLTVTGD